MPTRSPHPCAHPGCPQTVTTRFCARHGAGGQASAREPDTRQSSAERGYGARWRRIRWEHLQREPLCRSCRARDRITEARHVDHIVPKSRGGTDDDANLQSLCQPCHNAKTAAERIGRA